MNFSSDNFSSASEEDFSCLDKHLSRSSVTKDAWSIYKDFHYGSPIVAAILIVFLLVAFSSNLFIIVSMLWQRMLKQPAQILLLNLAISDLLVGVLVMPFTITSGIAREYVFGCSDYTRCRVCQSGITFVVFSQVSFHTIALLSLDRFLFIRFPLRYKQLVTVQRTAAVVLAVWVICVLLSLPPLFGFGEVKLSTSVGNCFVSFFGKTDVTSNVYYLLFLLIEATIPITILAVTNVWLLCIVTRHIRRKFQLRKTLTATAQDPELKRGSLTKKRSRQQVQLVKVFGAIFVANLITWLPAIALIICAPFVDFDHVPAEVIAIVYLSYISHTVIHPVLESWFIVRLRRLIAKCLCCGKEPLQGSPHRSSIDSSKRGSSGQTAVSVAIGSKDDSIESGRVWVCGGPATGREGDKGKRGVAPTSPASTEMSSTSPCALELELANGH